MGGPSGNGSGSSPLRAPHMRGNISSPATVDAQRSCKNRPVSEHAVKVKMFCAPKEFSKPFTVPSDISSRIFEETRFLGRFFGDGHRGGEKRETQKRKITYSGAHVHSPLSVAGLTRTTHTITYNDHRTSSSPCASARPARWPPTTDDGSPT